MAGRKRLAGVLVLCALGVAAAGAIASDDKSESSGAPGAEIAQVDEVEASAANALSILRRVRAGGDAMPAELATRIGDDHLYGVNPDLARLASGSISNSLFVLPGRGYVCASLTVGDGATLSCNPTSDLAAGQASPATVTLVGGDIGIYGLVPDGVDAVTVTTGSGSERALVTGNAYFAVAQEGTPLRTVSYDGPNGRVEYSIYDPASGTSDY